MRPWKKTQKAWNWYTDQQPKGKLKQEVESITRAKLKEELRREIKEHENADHEEAVRIDEIKRGWDR